MRIINVVCNNSEHLLKFLGLYKCHFKSALLEHRIYPTLICCRKFQFWHFLK